MKRGKVSDTILDRSVFKLLGRRGNTSKPAYGQDAAHIHNQGWDTLAAAATGSLAVYRAVNNISAAGGAADCIMNTIIIDEKSREIRLKEIIKELDRQCQVVGVGIAGGHTTVCPNVNSPVVSVTAIGHKLRTHQKAVAGQDIVMTKHIGMSGIRTVISHKRDEILNVLPEDVINKAFAADEELIIAKEAQIFIKQNIDGAMHDASEGGIFAALWDMAEYSGTGLDIDLRHISVKQDPSSQAQSRPPPPMEIMAFSTPISRSFRAASATAAGESSFTSRICRASWRLGLISQGRIIR